MAFRYVSERFYLFNNKTERRGEKMGNTCFVTLNGKGCLFARGMSVTPFGFKRGTREQTLSTADTITSKSKMSELTKEEIDDLRASFDMFDIDKSGTFIWDDVHFMRNVRRNGKTAFTMIFLRVRSCSAPPLVVGTPHFQYLGLLI